MTQTILPQQRAQTTGMGRYLAASLVAGAAAAILNNLIYLIMIAFVDSEWDLLTVVSITIASLLPNLLAGLLFWFLARFTTRARWLMRISPSAARSHSREAIFTTLPIAL